MSFSFNKNYYIFSIIFYVEWYLDEKAKLNYI